MPKQPESGWTHSRHLIGEMNNQVKEGMNSTPEVTPLSLNVSESDLNCLQIFLFYITQT